MLMASAEKRRLWCDEIQPLIRHGGKCQRRCSQWQQGAPNVSHHTTVTAVKLSHHLIAHLRAAAAATTGTTAATAAAVAPFAAFATSA